jgi:YD repeat-containing protein
LGQPAISTLATEIGGNCDVNLLRGTVVENVVDLFLPGPVFGWSHTRTYDSRLVKGSGGTELAGSDGIRWHGSALGPYITHSSGSPHVYVDASTKRVFTYSGYNAAVDYEATLTRDNPDTSNEVFTLRHTRTGEIFKFHGWHTNVAAQKRGRLKERINRRYETEATAGTQYSYNAQGLVSQVTTPQGWLVTYTYNTTGSEINRLQKVEVYDGTFNLRQKAE